MGFRVGRATLWAAGAAASLALVPATAGAPAAADTIVFSGTPNGVGAAQIFRIQTDGTGLQQLTKGAQPATDPAFSPEGNRVVFTLLGAGIFRVNLDGTGLHRLTTGSRDSYPVWSPDGRRIAFLRVHKAAWRVYVMAASGGKPRLLARAPSSGRPTWTADSKSLYLPAGGDFARVDASTGSVKSYFGATLDPMLAQAASVSPNAQLAVYIGRRTPTGAPDCGESHCPAFALYMSRAKRKAQRVAPDTGPAGWSPDSKSLVYVARGALILYATGNGKKTTIATGAHVVAAGDAPPAWQPR